MLGTFTFIISAKDNRFQAVEKQVQDGDEEVPCMGRLKRNNNKTD